MLYARVVVEPARRRFRVGSVERPGVHMRTRPGSCHRMLKKQLVPPSMGGTGVGVSRAYRVGDDRGKYLKQQGENDYANQRTGREGRGGGGRSGAWKRFGWEVSQLVAGYFRFDPPRPIF